MIAEKVSISTGVKPFEVTSKAFKHKGHIPAKYTCDGDNINPPLIIGNYPEGTKSLAIIVDDPDAPTRTWTHWIIWNIPPTHLIGEASAPGTEGITDMWVKEYSGPCPPSGTHRYFFKVYALNKSSFNLSGRLIGKDDLEKAIRPYIIGYGELIGLYKKVF